MNSRTHAYINPHTSILTDIHSHLSYPQTLYAHTSSPQSTHTYAYIKPANTHTCVSIKPHRNPRKKTQSQKLKSNIHSHKYTHIKPHTQGETGPRGIAIPLRHTTQGGAQETHRAFRVTLHTAQVSQNGKKSILTNSSNAVIPTSTSEFGPCDANKCAELVKGPVAGKFVGTVQKCSMHTCRETTTSRAMVLVEVNIGAGSFRLINTTYFVAEDKVPAGVVFTVERIGGSTGAKKVTYATQPFAVQGVSVAGIPGMFKFTHVYTCVCMHVYIYIYIYVYRRYNVIFVQYMYKK